MRILRINGSDVDIDDSTAIGITFQAYDFKEPGKRKLNISNSFTIPLTANNRALFGFADDIQCTNTDIYSKMTCDYWIDNEKLIDSAVLRIDEITRDRIKLYILQKDDFWESIKKYEWVDFLGDFANWLILKGEHVGTATSLGNRYSGTFEQFIDHEKNGSRLLIPMYLGNIAKYEYLGSVREDTTKIVIHPSSTEKSGHVCVYVKTIFSFLEYKYGVDFQLSSSDSTILWNDTYAPNIYIPLRDLLVRKSSSVLWSWYMNINFKYPPYDLRLDNKEKTIYDLVNAFFQLFNVIIDEKIIDGVNTFYLRRFDDIISDGDIIDWSGKYDFKNYKFKPYIKGYNKKNYIKYSNLYPTSDNEYEGSKLIECSNENLDESQDLFSLDCYYPDVTIALSGDAILNLDIEDSFETFEFLISDGYTTNTIEVKESLTSTGFNKTLQLAALYDINSEYTLLESIIEYPKFYEIERWLSLSDIINIQFFAQYFIKELNGCFFINKISGFNPEKSLSPTKLELIKISDDTPSVIGDVDFTDAYVDGIGDSFIDGVGNIFV